MIYVFLVIWFFLSMGITGILTDLNMVYASVSGILAFGLPVLVIIWRKRKKERNRAEVHNIKKQKFIRKIEAITELIDEYCSKQSPSAEETKAAWEEYHSVLELWGIPRCSTEVFPASSVGGYVFNELRSNEEPYDTAKRVEETITQKVYDFYYHIAYTYCLDVTVQSRLLSSVVGVLRTEEWKAKYLKLLEEGCRRESADAICLLADCYYEKKFVDLRDYEKAFSLYQQAAQLGDIHAVYKLGLCYENGHGTKKRDYQKAGDCYQYAYDNSKDMRYADALDKLYTAQKWDKNRYSPDIFTSNMMVMKKANLDKIKADVARLQANLEATEPKVAAVSLRIILEEVVNSFVECYENANLNDRLDEKISLMQSKGHFTREISKLAHSIRRLGNRGAHNASGEIIALDELQDAIESMEQIVEYYTAY